MLLVVNNLKVSGPGDFKLQGISFSQKKFEKIAIAGETGAGKSTVLKLVAGLLQPESGELLFEGEPIPGPADQLVPGHPRIAYLSQHFELQKSLRVEQVLAYSNKLSEREASGLYMICQIDHLLKRRTDELSGGEKQRVAICRLLISSPRLLLLDEPYAHLDMVHKNTLKDVIRDIGDKLKITCMLVSHDPLDTLSWADKIIVMRDGDIVQAGGPAEVYGRPVDVYTAGLFGKYNLIEGEHMRLFLQKRDSPPGKGALFARPEQFRLMKKSDRAPRGTVVQVRFYGTFREVDVKVGKKVLTVRTVLNVAAGEPVFVSLSPKGLWRLPTRN